MNLILEQKSDFRQGQSDIREQTLRRWAAVLERMLQRDGRTPEQIEAVIRWARADPFWCANILSAESLRQRFDTLELQS